MAKTKKSDFPPFPSDNVSQSDKKKKDWNLQWVKAVYHESSRDVVGNIEDNRRKFVNLRRYAAGQQDRNKYKPQLSASGNTAQLNLNWDVSTPAPTIIESLVGRMENQGLKINIKSISPIAKTEYDKEYRRLKAQAFLAANAPKLERLGVNVRSQIDETEAETLTGDKEIKLYLDTTFKDSYSMAMQSVIDFVLESNDFAQIRRKMYRDSAVCGRVFLNISFDNDYEVKLRISDLVNMTTDYSEYDDFRDCKWMGEYRYITIDEIAEKGDFNEKELHDIAKLAANRYGNSSWDTGWDLIYYPTINNVSRPYGRFKIKVLEAEYKSIDKYKYEEVKERNGGVFYRRIDLRDKNGNLKKPKDKNNKIVEKKLANIYRATLICGTDYIFEYGQKENQLRDKIKGFGHSSDTPFSWVGFCPDMYDMKNTSIMEKLVPLVDQLCITRLQAQRAIANMTPQGVAVDVAAAAAVSNALGEEQITPRTLHDIYKQTGTYYYSSLGEDGRPINAQGGLPIRDLPPPDLSLLQQLEARAASIIQDMSLVSGVPISTVGAPDVKALVGNEKIAAQNRNDATRVLDDTFKNVLSRSCNLITLMVQDSIEYGGKWDDYAMAVGELPTKTLDFTSKFCAMQFGMFIEVAPDIVEQEFFEKSLLGAVQADKIKQSDVFILRDLAKRDLRAAARYMQIWEDQYTKEKARLAQVNSQAQSQAQAMAAMAQTKAEIQKMSVEYQLKARHLQLEYGLKSQESQQDHIEEMKQIALEGEMKIEQIETAMEGGGREEGGGDSQKSDYERLGMPKSSGVRLPSTSVATKPNV